MHVLRKRKLFKYHEYLSTVKTFQERKRNVHPSFTTDMLFVYSVNLRILHIIALLFIYPLRPVCKENLMVSKVTIKLTLNIKKNNLAITHYSVKETSK